MMKVSGRSSAIVNGSTFDRNITDPRCDVIRDYPSGRLYSVTEIRLAVSRIVNISS